MSISNFFASPALKLAGIGFLILLLMIPLALVDDLRQERENRRDQVVAEISHSVGGEQTVYAPVLRVPFISDVYGTDGKITGRAERYWLFAAQDLTASSSLKMEQRRRGIFEVPVYVAEHDLQGAFEFDPKAVAGIPGEPILGRAELLLPISAARALRKLDLKLDGKSLPLGAGADAVSEISAFAAPVADFSFDRTLSYHLEIAATGAQSLDFVPLAANTEVRIDVPWPHPSFRGNFLPSERKIGDAGFQAHWQVLAFNREIPAFWPADQNLASTFGKTYFGVAFVEPVDVYFLNHRSAKYGFLFLVLTFAAFFLFETLGRSRVHAIQYLLVGAALAVFYLVLLACSEHFGFAWSYLLAAASMGLMISAYAAAVMRSLKRAAVIGLWLGVLYTALYVMINLEDFALLMGAVLTALMLALAMFLTRRVDWYGAAREERPTPAGGQQ